ncbi:YhdP family protein [Wolbachia endosymbiont of Ctenocephalides felis wCfeT]|uniref:YhdP family protein n=1 Tax=Wolbachia endosymbiont of Ctenocephalides felis wCfeT TaxID=2732593 RepID=UPI001445354C|nr:AsmA-like C-terminal domain-containing protein [Wolbachia endosymbiont of Ctenocephalides felis wCfeT]
MLKKITVLSSIILLFAFCLFVFFKSKNSLEINVNYVDFYVKNKIAKVFANSDVSMQDTSIIWQKDGKNPYLVITDLTIKNPNFTIKVPEFFVHFKFSSLFKTNAKFTQVLADNIRIHTNQADLKAVSFSLQHSLKAAREFFFSLSVESKIEFTNIVVNESTENKFLIDKIYIDKKEDFNVLNVYVHTKDGKGILDDLFITIKNHNNSLNAYGTFYDLKLGLFSEVFASVKNYNLDKNVGLKGNFLLKINDKGEVVDGNVYVLSTENNANDNSSLTNVNINLAYNAGIMNVRNFHFKFRDIYLSLMGKMNFDIKHALFRVNISRLAAKDLCVYVPDGVLNKKFQDWYCENIDGNIVNTILSFNGKIKDLFDDDLSDVVIVADIENGSVKFDEDFEQVRELNGDLIIKNNNLKINVNNAKFQNFTINGGDIEMNSLDKDDSVLTINGQAVSDAYGLYEPVRFKLDDAIPVTRDDMSGTANSVFGFRILNINADDKEVDFSANFHSEIDDLAIYDANIGKYDLKLNFGSDFTNLRGSGIVNDTQLLFDLKSSNKNETFTWSLAGDLPAQILNFDKDIGGYISANVESVINAGNTGHIKGNIDLSGFDSRSSYLGWKNKIEDHNQISFSVKLQGIGKLSVDRLEIVGSNLDIKFGGKKENGTLYLNSSSFKLPDNNFSVDIESSKEKDSIAIYGEKANLSDILELLNRNSNKIVKKIEVSMDIDSIIMKEGTIIKDASLNLTCIGGNCDGSQFTGQFLEDSSKIFAEYSGIGLELYADNAGILLRSLGINKSIKDGKLSFYLSSERENEERYGMLSISHFYVKDAPLLTTLLSMSSLPGIVNAIKNEGVHFHKCNAPFSYKDGTIEIEESWVEGAELGISTSGKLDIKDYKFQVEGQVIPAYSINQTLLKIPILGKLLTGGKSRGIISIDYKASGDNEDSNVLVDVISSLTPSLLKRVLGVFDRLMTRATVNTTATEG